MSCAPHVRMRARFRRILAVPLLVALGACGRQATALSSRDGAIPTEPGADAPVFETGGNHATGGTVGGTTGGAPGGGAGGGGGGGTGGSSKAEADGSLDLPGRGGFLPPNSGGGGGSGGAKGTGGFSGVGLRLLAGFRGGAGVADGIGRSARFTRPWSVASDGAGNLFVADTFSHTIRKVTLASGAVATVAGLPGVSGYADGTASAARFYNPDGLACDSKGVLYISDQYNRTIRKLVIATGEVTTLAGSPGVGPAVDGIGAAAHFAYPAGLALDGAGNLFVADVGFHTIRRMSLATAEVTTLAGRSEHSGSADGKGTDAEFSGPSGLAFDSVGSLYVADTGNHTIRRIDVATGAVATLVGSAGNSGSVDGIGTAARLGAPNGIAYDGAGNLLVSDYANSTLRKVSIATAAVTTLAGSAGLSGSADGTGSAARFNTPVGLSLDGGNLLVADYMDNTIRKLDLTTTEVTTLAGAASVSGSADGSGDAARFSLPAGMATDAAGNLFVADAGNNTIRRIAAGGDVVTTLAGSPGTSGSLDAVGTAAVFFSPFDVTCDDSGNLFVADTGNHTLRAIVTATASVTTLAGAAGRGVWTDGVGELAGFESPAALAWGMGGILVVSDANEIRRVAIASATVSTLAGAHLIPNGPVSSGSSDGVGSDARFFRPNGIALDGAGNAYVADQGNHTIRKVVIASGAVTTIAGSPGQPGAADGIGSVARFSYPEAVAYDGAGSLFVADKMNHSVRKIVLATATVTTYVGSPTAAVIEGPLPAGLNAPMGLAVGRAGELYITDENAVLVVK
jgi:sugar lactone lactonase YvrE